LPWQPDTALVIADAYTGDGLLQEEAPSAILQRQLEGNDPLIAGYDEPGDR